MEHLSEILLSRLSDFIANHIGLYFPEARWRDLERGIHAAAREFEFDSAEACVQWLMSAPLTRLQIEVLASHLTVGETYFLRDRKTFTALEEEILPQLIRSRRGGERQLRIWSAGGCTGEEAYSIAMLFDRILPDVANWHVTILATDINPRFLRHAAGGSYNHWSFRDTPSWMKERYFQERKSSRFEILPRIKRMVTFSYLNLAEDSYPSLTNNTNAMDLILCRNVLMYFAPDTVRKVVGNLYRCLVDGGWLIVSPTEVSHTLFGQFVTINFCGMTFYRKAQSLDLQVPTFEFRPFLPETKLETPNIEVEPGLGTLPPMSEVGIPGRAPSPSDNSKPETSYSQPEPNPYTEAVSLYEQGQYSAAVQKLEELVIRGPNRPEVMALLARTHANQGKLTEAQEWSEKAIATDKLNPGFYYLRATILHEQGRTDEASLALKKALYLDQNFVLAHFALGNIARQQGRHKESEKYFGNALTLLTRYRQEEVLPEADGLTAGRLAEVIQATVSAGGSGTGGRG